MTTKTRDELIKELGDLCPYTLQGVTSAENATRKIADFILNREQSIMEEYEAKIAAARKVLEDENLYSKDAIDKALEVLK
jgi:hypothetical protein